MNLTLLKYMWIAHLLTLWTFGSTVWCLKLNIVSPNVLGSSLGFCSVDKKLDLALFLSRVGLIEAHMRGGVKVYVDCPSSLHQFGLLILPVGA